MSLLPLEEALAVLLGDAQPVRGEEQLALAPALGRILRTDQFAALDVPPWDNSAMDGYAVRAVDGGRSLPVRARFLAGDPPGSLPADAVARIFTGAPIPAGADAVVLQEDVPDPVAGREDVVLPADLRAGQHIRPRGQDCRAGDLLLAQGRRLRPQDLGLVASQGIAQLPVYRTLRVALLSTGSELVEAGRGELPPGAIFNSNRPMLGGLLTELGCEVVDLGIVPDDFDATRALLERAAQEADVVVSSGGVSVGEADHVRAAVESLGALQLWRIAIKPGKPFAFGKLGTVPFLGLPGNPASAFVTFVLLARPYLARMQGRDTANSVSYPARADFEVQRPGQRAEYLRVSLRVEEGAVWATPYANQSSGVLRSIAASDALACVPVGATVARGQMLEVLPLDLLLQ